MHRAKSSELAKRAVARYATPPLYGRVDLVRDADGHPMVMEFEVVEPELWLRRHPSGEPARDAVARTLAVTGPTDSQ